MSVTQQYLVFCSLALVMLTTVNTGPVCRDAQTKPEGIPKCHCEGNGTKIDCRSKRFTKIPPGIPTTTRILYLGQNNLIYLPDHAFNGLNYLEELNLENNAIKSISTTAFAGLPNLQILRLTGNNIRYTEHFDQSLMLLTSLRVIEIQQSFNELENGELLPKKALKNMPHLHTMSVDVPSEDLFSNFTSQTLVNLNVFKIPNAEDRCQIKTLQRNVFRSVFPSLRRVVLQNCHIEVIENGSFEHMFSLQYLDLSYNEQLGFKVLTNLSLSLSNVTTLMLNQINPSEGDCIKIEEEHLRPLANWNLKQIYLENNRLSSVDISAVEYVPKHLETISVSGNQMIIGLYVIRALRMNVFKNVRLFNISNQDMNSFLSEIVSRLKRGRPRYRRGMYSQNLTCDNNSLLDPPAIPPNLNTIDLSHSKIDLEIRNGLSIPFPNELRHLNLSRNRFRTMNGHFCGFYRLESLDFSMNSCKNISQFMFHNLPALKVLDMSNNFLGFVFQEDKDGIIFSKLQNLTKLDLSGNLLKYLPYKLFSGLSRLGVLKLSNNRMKCFNVQISHLQALATLYLNRNDLETLSDDVIRNLDNFDHLKVDLSENELKCTCANKEFVRWLSGTKVTLFSDGGSVCTLADGSSGNLTHNMDLYFKLDKECTNYTLLVAITSICVLVFVFTIVTAIVYRYRWSLRYLYYSARFKLKGYVQMPDTFDFDAFVCYSDEDKQFLTSELIPELEEKRGVRLCIHERDFRGGTTVTNNVVRAITSSNKTIVVMSRSFTVSGWCKFELNMARMEEINMGRDVLCVIRIEDFPLDDVPLEVLSVMKNQTYLDFPEDKSHTKLFWDRVKDSVLK